MVGGKSWAIVKTTSSFKRTKELFLHVFVGIYKHRVKDIQEPSTIPLIFHWFSLIFPNEPSWTISGIFQDPYVHNTCILTHEFAQCLCRFRGWTFIQSYKNSSGSTIRPRSAEPQRESPKYRMIYMYIYIYILGWLWMKIAESSVEACRMRLCIFGIEDLDALETAVSNSFGAVPPASPAVQLDFAEDGLPFKEKDSRWVGGLDWWTYNFHGML